MSKKPLSSKRRWMPTDVLKALRQQSDLSAKYNQRHRPSLYGAAVRHFGSWKKAVEASGFHYPSVARKKTPGFWSQSKVIEEIKGLSQCNSNHVRKHRADLYNAALRFFGGWREAVEAAGLSYESVQRTHRPHNYS